MRQNLGIGEQVLCSSTYRGILIKDERNPLNKTHIRSLETPPPCLYLKGCVKRERLYCMNSEIDKDELFFFFFLVFNLVFTIDRPLLFGHLKKYYKIMLSIPVFSPFYSANEIYKKQF